MAVNIIPLIGVWFYNWDARRYFFVYCMETVIVGLINVIKMACVTLFVRSNWCMGKQWRRSGMQSGWFYIFFIIHYGFLYLSRHNYFWVEWPVARWFHCWWNIQRYLYCWARMEITAADIHPYYSIQVVFGFLHRWLQKCIHGPADVRTLYAHICSSRSWWYWEVCSSVWGRKNIL